MMLVFDVRRLIHSSLYLSHKSHCCFLIFQTRHIINFNILLHVTGYVMCFSALPPANIHFVLASVSSPKPLLSRFSPIHTDDMPPSALNVWVCGDCSAMNDDSQPGPCVLCDAPQPKCRAVAIDSSVPAASAAVASLVLAKFAPKCRPVGATHPSGLVLDIVGIAAGDHGRCCEDHMVCCGQLLEKDPYCPSLQGEDPCPKRPCREGEETVSVCDGHYCQLGDGRR